MKISVFTKVFSYTILLLILMSMAAVLLFAREFMAFYRTQQQRQLAAAFQPMLSIISDRDKSLEDIMEAARTFASNNQSFNFIIHEGDDQEGDGKVLFSTSNGENFFDDSAGLRIRVAAMTRNQGDGLGNAYIFTGYGTNFGIDYNGLIRRSFLALAFMLVIAVLGAVVFAKKVTKPLEDEIIRRRTMEENQRLFFSAASHELKTPIAAARALVEGMIAGVGDYKDHPKYLRECIKTLDAQTNLVSEILEIVKLSGDQTGEPDALDIRELINTVVTEYRPMAEQRGLFIQVEIKKVYILAERNLLQRVLSNIIANAVQNTCEGGTIRIETKEHKKLRLSIFNTGAFIPEEVISRLFEPFYRQDIARTRHTTNSEVYNTQSGLGLVIVKKALDRMKCAFALENKSEGVLFWVDLPVSTG